jgi:hypothetical protein
LWLPAFLAEGGQTPGKAAVSPVQLLRGLFLAPVDGLDVVCMPFDRLGAVRGEGVNLAGAEFELNGPPVLNLRPQRGPKVQHIAMRRAGA